MHTAPSCSRAPPFQWRAMRSAGSTLAPWDSARISDDRIEHPKAAADSTLVSMMLGPDACPSETQGLSRDLYARCSCSERARTRTLRDLAPLQPQPSTARGGVALEAMEPRSASRLAACALKYTMRANHHWRTSGGLDPFLLGWFVDYPRPR